MTSPSSSMARVLLVLLALAAWLPPGLAQGTTVERRTDCLRPSVAEMDIAAKDLRKCRRKLKKFKKAFHEPHFVNLHPACLWGFAEFVARLEDNAFACQEQLFPLIFRKTWKKKRN